MKIYEVWTSDNERRSSSKGTCDSIEAALEFAKSISDWYESRTLYEKIMSQFGTIQNLKENISKCYNLREIELITLATLASK